MLGNDVVDLADEDCAAVHPRFDRRVFAPEELRQLEVNPEPKRCRWLLWAAKESAFKAVKKLDERAVFSPIRFRVTLESPSRAAVHGLGRSLAIVFDGSEAGAIHAIALADGAPRGTVMAALRQLPENPDPEFASAAARALAIESLGEFLEVDAREISLTFQHRVPRLRVRGVPIEVSLSHHGRFVAVACSSLSPNVGSRIPAQQPVESTSGPPSTQDPSLRLRGTHTVTLPLP